MTLDTTALKRKKVKKKKQAFYEFKPEDVYFMQQTIMKGELDISDKKRLTEIYQQRVNPNFTDICDGCHEVAKQAFKRMIKIMCDSLKVNEHEFKIYRFPAESSAAVSQDDEILDSPEPEKKQGFFSKLFKSEAD